MNIYFLSTFLRECELCEMKRLRTDATTTTGRTKNKYYAADDKENTQTTEID